MLLYSGVSNIDVRYRTQLAPFAKSSGGEDLTVFKPQSPGEARAYNQKTVSDVKAVAEEILARGTPKRTDPQFISKMMMLNTAKLILEPDDKRAIEMVIYTPGHPPLPNSDQKINYTSDTADVAMERSTRGVSSINNETKRKTVEVFRHAEDYSPQQIFIALCHEVHHAMDHHILGYLDPPTKLGKGGQYHLSEMCGKSESGVNSALSEFNSYYMDNRNCVALGLPEAHPTQLREEDRPYYVMTPEQQRIVQVLKGSYPHIEETLKPPNSHFLANADIYSAHQYPASSNLINSPRIHHLMTCIENFQLLHGEFLDGTVHKDQLREPLSQLEAAIHELDDEDLSFLADIKSSYPFWHALEELTLLEPEQENFYKARFTRVFENLMALTGVTREKICSQPSLVARAVDTRSKQAYSKSNIVYLQNLLDKLGKMDLVWLKTTEAGRECNERIITLN
jgi:hypothetical protein